MPNLNTHSPFVLFFDCYIVSSKMGLEESCRIADARLGQIYLALRSQDTAYRHAAKLDIVKYTLLSYLDVPWDEVYLRVECEDEDDRADFFAFARKHFPFAHVVNERSATAREYHAALLPLRRHGNPWVFYCPNNDHPMVGDPHAFGPLLTLAEEVEAAYPGHVVGVQYSHFTESQMAMEPDRRNWLYSVAVHGSVGETEHANVVRQDRFVCDSIIIYRLDALIEMFATATHAGRCIRLEETGHLYTTRFRQVLVVPKRELCRHYDGYMHVGLPTAPLFIPDGFFDAAIRIRYGFADRKPGYVNVNPYETYSFDGGAADVRSLLSELPVFWRDRIASVEIDPDMRARYAARPQDAFQFGALRDPYDSDPLTNYLRSAWRVCGQPLGGFDPAAGSVQHIALAAGERCADSTDGTYSAVYFVRHGAVRVGGTEYHKGELVMIQGEAQFEIEALQQASVVRARVPVASGATACKFFKWPELA